MVKKDKNKLTLNMISHDLRTAISTIISFTRLLINSEELGEKNLKFANAILESGEKTILQINEYLLLGKTKTKNISKICRKVGYIKDLIEKEYSILKTSNSKMVIIIGAPAYFLEEEVLINDRLFCSLFNNLIKNAIESYSTKMEAEIVVHLHRERDLLSISISNNIEIPKEIRSEIFKPFFTTKKFSTGIGLRSARMMAKANRGKLKYHSFDGGTKFEFMVPFFS